MTNTINLTYRATDGTTFTSYLRYLDYQEKLRKEIFNSLEEIKSLRGWAPFDGSEISEKNDFYWISLKKPEDAKKLNEYFCLSRFDEVDENFEGIVCVEEDKEGKTFLHYLKDMQGYALQIMKRIKEAV